MPPLGLVLSPQDMAADQKKIVTLLSKRAEKDLGPKAAVIASKGPDAITIRLPGANEAEVEKAKTTLGTSARIEFYDARNVATAAAPKRPYRVLNAPNSIIVSFIAADNKKIEPDTPEYRKMMEEWTPIAGGSEMYSAVVQTDRNGHPVPVLHFTADGEQRFNQWSVANNHRGEMLAAVLDGKCISIAPLANGAVIRADVLLPGPFPPGYVQQLVDELNDGPLPLDLKFESAERYWPHG